MASQKDITKRNYMIFKTSVIRNDLTGTDDFRFLKRYEPYGYNSQVSPINRVVRFDTEHPAFTFLEKATVTPISFCPENYRSKYSMSMGEVLLFVYEDDDYDELQIDVYYRNRNQRDNGNQGYVVENLDDLAEWNFEDEEAEYIKEKIKTFWDAYNYSEKPNFKELQEEYLSWYPINK